MRLHKLTMALTGESWTGISLSTDGFLRTTPPALAIPPATTAITPISSPMEPAGPRHFKISLSPPGTLKHSMSPWMARAIKAGAAPSVST